MTNQEIYFEAFSTSCSHLVTLYIISKLSQSYLMATCLVRVLCCCWISSWAASKLKAFLVSVFLMLPLLKLLLLFFTLADNPPPLLSTG